MPSLTNPKATKATKSTKATKAKSTKSTKPKVVVEDVPEVVEDVPEVVEDVLEVALEEAPSAVEETLEDALEETPSETPAVDVRSLKKFDSPEQMIAFVEAMISDVTDIAKSTPKSKENTVCNKTLRTILTNMRVVKRNIAPLCKKKKRVTRTGTSSGFLRPVHVSADMRKFTGWTDDSLHSRVDVTKFICDYIKKHDLQNPLDRRQINPDTKLKKLLGIKGVMTDPLHYYNIQTHIKHHFSQPSSA